MMRKVLVVLSAGLIAALFAACSFESSVPDAGYDGEQDPEYPPPPYGANYGDTAENIQVELVACNEDGTGMGRAWALEEYLESKAVLITVHAGWCGYCKQQALNMDDDLAPFLGNGLNVLLLLTEDPQGKTTRQLLLDYACKYKDDYGFSFPVGIDPGGAATGQFFSGVPLNMLLDQDMTIRYRVVGDLPEDGVLEGNIEGLLNE